MKGVNVLILDELRNIRYHPVHHYVNAVDVCLCLGMNVKDARNHVNNPFIISPVFAQPDQEIWDGDWVFYWRHLIIFVTELVQIKSVKPSAGQELLDTIRDAQRKLRQ